MSEATVGTQKLVVLSLETMMDSKGNTLLAEAADKLQRIEEKIQQYLDENLGNPPTKEYELTIAVKVLATDETGRQLSWGVSMKEPKLDRTHLQHVISRDGQMVTMDPQAFQAMLPLERGGQQ